MLCVEVSSCLKGSLWRTITINLAVRLELPQENLRNVTGTVNACSGRRAETTRLPGEDELCNKLFSTDVKVEILALFHNNPGLVDSVEDVARRIGRTVSEIDADVKDLLDVGILVKDKVSEFDIVSLDANRDKEIQEIISNQIKMGRPQAQ